MMHTTDPAGRGEPDPRKLMRDQPSERWWTRRVKGGWLLLLLGVIISGFFAFLSGATWAAERCSCPDTTAARDTAVGHDPNYSEPWPPPADVKEILRERTEQLSRCRGLLTVHRQRLHKMGHYWTGEYWIRR